MFLLVDDVDDSRHSGGVKACRGIVDDLDRLDVGGGNAIEPTLTAETGEARLPAVDEDGDLVTATKRDLTFLIDRHARKALHRIEQRSGRLGRSFVELENPSVEPRCPDCLRGDRDLLLEALQAHQADVAEVVRLVELADENVDLRRVETRK